MKPAREEPLPPFLRSQASRKSPAHRKHGPFPQVALWPRLGQKGRCTSTPALSRGTCWAQLVDARFWRGQGGGGGGHHRGHTQHSR